MMKRLVLISSFFVACVALCLAAQPTLASAATAPSKAAANRAPARKTSLVTVAARKRHRRYYSRRYHYRGPMRPSTSRVTEIQTALQRSGYYKGDPNGKWDAGSVQAMRNFQEDHGLDGNGKIDALSLQKLGLGSEIAGVDAPRPPAPKTSLPVGQSAPAAIPASGVKPQTPQTPQAPKVPSSGPSTSPTPATPSATSGTSTVSSSSKTNSLQ